MVLDEPAPPISREVPVIVEFPDEKPEPPATPKKWHWEESRKRQDGYAGSVADELIRQRRGE